jgi:hypothetical protein
MTGGERIAIHIREEPNKTVHVVLDIGVGGNW